LVFNAHCRDISFIYATSEEEQEGTIINQPVFAQIGVPSDTIVLNKTNMTTEIPSNISEDTTITIFQAKSEWTCM
jgi:hypothetical protein